MTAKQRRRQTSRPPARTIARGTPSGLLQAQHTFCLEYMSNGFNATNAYMKGHPDANKATAATEGWRYLRIPKIAAYLMPQLEAAWKPLQMGGEQALARIAMLVEETTDERVKLMALKIILEQSGKLRTVADSLDVLAAAIRGDQAKHGITSKG